MTAAVDHTEPLPLPPTRNRLLSLLVAAAVVATIGIFLFFQVWDYDIWWQVAIGRDIIASHVIPRLDRFTAAAFGRPYHDSHLLFQIAAALADRIGGMVGIQLLAAGVWSLTLLVSFRSLRRWVSVDTAAMLVLLLAMASMERFIPRPEIVTYLAIAAFYLLLQERRFLTSGGLLMMIALQVVWTNSHGLFVLGPFMAGCSWLAAAVTPAREGGHRHLARLSLLLVLLLAATLVTPYGLDNWRYALLLATEVGSAAPKYLQGLGELSPTFGRDTAGGAAFWFYLVLALATMATAIPRLLSRTVSVERLLMVSGLFLLSLTGRRNMVLFALGAAPFLGENLAPLLPRLPRPALLKALLLPLIALLAYSGISGSYQRRVSLPTRFGLGASPLVYPQALPAFLRQIGYQGQVFNSNILGGFYLYHEYPPLRPFTDGRWEIYDPHLFDSPLPDLEARFGINAYLLQHSCPDARQIYPLLFKSPDWRLVYYDYTASFWLKRGSMPAVPAIDLRLVENLPPATPYLENRLLLDTFFYHGGITPARLGNLRQATELQNAPERLYEQLGTLEISAGSLATAKQTFTRLREKFPGNSRAYNGLAYIAAETGDLTGAEEVLAAGLRRIPGDREISDNLNRLRAFGGKSMQPSEPPLGPGNHQ